MKRPDVEVERRRAFRARDVEERYREQGGVCATCPAPIDIVFVRDHRVPRALGGKTTKANLDLICEACNAAKTHGKWGDIANVAKVNRLRRKADPVTRPRSKRPFKGRGWDKRRRRRMDGKVERRD